MNCPATCIAAGIQRKLKKKYIYENLTFSYFYRVSDMRDRERSWLTFENTVSMIMKASMRTPRRACIKRLMTVDETKELEIKRGAKIYILM